MSNTKRSWLERPHKYILQGHEVVATTDVLTWARWFETSWPARRVARTVLLDGSVVSTVFLGLDHAFSGPPQLFESAFLVHADAATPGEETCQIRRRYATWAEAEVGHIEMCEEVAHILPEWKAKPITEGDEP